MYAATADAYNFPNNWFIRDDAYYYFKVAQNITEGLGSTFDGINPTNGYHPLWLLICIPIFYLARFDLILPLRVLLIVIAIFNAATAVLIYRVISRSLSNAVAVFAAVSWAFNGYIHYALYRPGLESPLAAFAIVLFIERLGAFESTWRTKKVTTTQIGWLAVMAAIVMFSRLDLIFLAVIAGIYIVFRGHPIRFLLPFDIAIIFLSMTSSIALRVGFPAYNSYAASAVNATVIALAIKIVTFYFMGLYQHPKMRTIQKLLRQTFIASTISSAIFSGVMMMLGMKIDLTDGFPRAALALDWVISFSFIFTLRFFALRFGNQTINTNLSTPDPLNELRSNWRIWLTDGWAYYRVLGGALALYMLYNKIAFGTSSPVSGQIKRWWGTLLHTAYDKPAANWADFLGVGYGNAYDVWQPLSHNIRWLAILIKPIYRGSNTEDERYYIVIAALALFIFSVLFFNARRALYIFSKMALIPLFASSGIHILSYTATAYGGAKEWYWISELLLTIFIFSIMIDLALRPVQKYKPIRVVLETSAIAAGIYFALGLNGFIVVNMPHGAAPANRPYMEVVTYLEENTPPNARIGMTGGGNVGYFIQDRKIINMDGLINSYDYFQALKNESAADYLHQRGIRFVFSNTKILTYQPYDKQFSPYLSSYNVYGGKSLMRLLGKPK